VGLLAFGAVFTLAGYGVLAPLVAFRSAWEAVSLAGLAYLAGLAAVGTLLTLVVLAGVPLGIPAVLATAAVVAATGLLLSRRRTPPSLPRRRTGRAEAIAGAVLLAAVVVVLEAGFRAARLHGLSAWDAGAFWVPKAETLFFTGEFDAGQFGTLPNPSYPPLVPILQASAFALMGGATVSALHLVAWSALAGAALGAGALLSRFAGPALAWGAALLLVTAPEVVDAGSAPQADVLLDLLLGFVLLLLVLASRTRRLEPVALALVFAAGAALTKREGLLVLACVAGATVLTWRRPWRSRWHVAALVGVTALAVTIPWRIWFTRRSLMSDAPEAGGAGLLDHLDRFGPSLSLVLRTLGDLGEWSALPAVALLAVATAALGARRREAALVAAFLGFCVIGFTWVMWAFPSLPLTQQASLNPIVRLSGSALIPARLCAPLLLPRLRALGLGRAPARRPAALTAAVVAVVALAYPVAVLAVDGRPRFPSRDDCSDRIAEPTPPFEVVYVRSPSLTEARAARDRLVALGFVDAQTLADGCGRWKVVNLGVQTAEQLRGHLADAHRVGYDPWIERA
jgi:4-amino-4-deoxy-L-arabinose transferase-like glycosyltransferase